MTDVNGIPNDIVWDLSDLFAGPDDPLIEHVIADAVLRAKRFEQDYKGKIDSPRLTAKLLGDAIREYEAIAQAAAKPAAYASLRHAADTSDPARGALLQRMMEKGTQVSLAMLFFDLELAAAADSVIGPLLEDPYVKPYRHYIENERRSREFLLSEAEERILEETANTGSRAFRRLFEEIVSRTTFRVGEDDLSQSQTLALLYSPDRERRREGAAALSAGLGEQVNTVAYIFNTLLQDKAVKDRLRRYDYPEQSRHLSNELDRETVEIVVNACTSNFSVVNRYYSLKRQILGVSELTHFDRYAPLFASEDNVTWDQAREIVLEAFGEFSSEMRAAASEFFEKRWIDAAPRKGKRGGAFCSYVTPDLHPFILQSYLGRGKDVTTLAHELGHGVHSSVSRGQSYLNFHGTLPMAELASTFGEMLVFDKLQKSASLKERLALYADKIEGSFATIFRQAAMFRFEQAIHKHRREHGELTVEDFGNYWQTNIQAMFGDSVILGEEHKSWWSYVNHFVASPFYVYAYSVGELLVLSLYRKYKNEGPGFAVKYFDLLRAGGSLSPQQLMDKVGVDLHDPQFWADGIKILDDEVSQFEAILTECGREGGLVVPGG
ncbi:MAG: M3 family oligoendopeptidase [Capsulimonadaceae bacterium]|nr:M3 family oligoendopeptidase [Capsulimonadaceae bacterium]